MAITDKKHLLPIVIGGSLFLVTLSCGIWILAAENKKNNISNNSNTSLVSFSPTAITAFSPTLIPTTIVASPTGITNTSTATSTPVPTATNTPQPSSKYKSGTYTVTGSYRVPRSNAQQMKVELTLSNDVITSINVTPMADDSESYFYQQNFADGISGKIIGKTLDNAANISRVNGASLTTDYFTGNVVSDIQNKAAN